MRLELVGLHRVYIGHVLLLVHKILIHVQQNVTDLLHHVFLQLPDLGDLVQKLVVRHLGNKFRSYWLQHLLGRFLDVVVEEFAILIQG